MIVSTMSHPFWQCGHLNDTSTQEPQWESNPRPHDREYYEPSILAVWTPK